METRVYYGAYTLQHWIDMLLRQELVLPEYQRSFKWKPSDIRHFIDSIKANQFIPSVTIGVYSRNGIKHNYIIDGQQRLTALLLAKIGFYPRSERFRFQDMPKINENDDEHESDERIEWTFETLIKSKSTETDIIRQCAMGDYDQFNCNVNNDFFSSNYLGFAYIVPHEQDEAKQLPYFATVFRNINFQGIALSDMESRKALYYWKDSLTNWFEPAFFNNLFHNSRALPINLDFVRYISYLSQYIKENQNIQAVFKGTYFTAEGYYEKYIYSVAQGLDDSVFGKFTNLFPNEEYQGDIERLNQSIHALGYADQDFDSIVKLDLYLFGLIYYIVFLHKQYNISNEQREELIHRLDDKIKHYTPKHKRSPAAKKWLRMRISDSVDIFGIYFRE